MGRKSGNLLRMRVNRTDAPAGVAQVTNTDGHQDRCSSAQLPRWQQVVQYPEPVFLNVYGAQESIPRNEFRQPM